MKVKLCSPVEPFDYRILCIGETWFGSDARSAFAALRRLGNSVEVVDPNYYLPDWHSTFARGIRKLLRPLFVRELTRETLQRIKRFKPDCLFVFKGNWVQPEIVRECRQAGITTVVYYPDVSFLSHGQYIPKTLPLYDHIFTAKSFGVHDMASQLGVSNISFLEPGFDPELHRPIELTDCEKEVFGADVSFIGTWSQKKESILAALRAGLQDIRIRIWGYRWENCSNPQLRSSIMGYGITGDDYVKAICGSKICLGLLSEAGKGSSSGDYITARTFQIPACGTFMLHERNPEILQYFSEGLDVECFSSAEELIGKVRFCLEDDHYRNEVGATGLKRSVEEDYSIDRRMNVLLRWLDLRSGRRFSEV
jgi:spore maturation protein CgeB